MTHEGTSMYDTLTPADGVPPRVLAAVAEARRLGFRLCVHPATGRLLAALASGVPAGGVIGETGTGTGAGVGWMRSTAPPSSRLVTVEIDGERAAAAAGLYADDPGVTVVHGDAAELAAHGPFDLLVIDCGDGGAGPLDRATLEPRDVLRPGGVLFKDDLWPMTDWPPRTFDGDVDDRRVRLFEHPDLLATEVTVAEGYAVQLARLRP